MKIVLDAWAILAYLQQEEPAAIRVKTVLQETEARKMQVFISIINIGEVFYTIGRRQGEKAAEETLEEIRHLPITIMPAEPEIVIKAARLKIHHTLSYADAFAVVLTQELNATLLSGDPELSNMHKIVSIEKLKRH
jgi:predicted nucleic acid-binding protein